MITAQIFDITMIDDFEASNRLAILFWCFDEESKPLLVRTFFKPFFYIQLPDFVNGNFITWNSDNAGKVAKAIKVTEYEFCEKYLLHYFQGDRKYPMLKLTFNSLKESKRCEKILEKPVHVDSIGWVKLKPLENKEIKPIRKLLSLCNIRYSQWFTFEGVEPEEKISTITEYISDWRTFKPKEMKKVVKPKLCSVDIETFTVNEKTIPDPLRISDVCFMISCVFEYKRVLIVMGNISDIEDCEVIRCSDECDMIERFADVIQREDPDVICGYNIFGYDFPYLDTRIKIRMKDWPKRLSRLLEYEVDVKKKCWKSSAYGFNKITYLDMPGRICIDLYHVIKRDYRLDKYTLSFVSKLFLKNDKDDVSPKEIFETYRTGKDLKRVGEYCIKDSELVIQLFNRLNTWITLVELSSIVGVNIVELFTRGQKVRCVSQLYDIASKNDYVIDQRTSDKINYTGGFVCEPITGIHDNIVCIDFASLYPSIIIAYNICYTTLIPKEFDDQIPDEECHVIHYGDMKIKFIKQKHRVGLLPMLVEQLVRERRQVKAEKAEDEMRAIVLDKRQNALKISANSIYGFLGFQEGSLPLVEGAVSITTIGRELINQVNQYVTEKGGRVIYGDTDSSMVDLNTDDPITAGKRLAEEINCLFPQPLKVEFEKAMRLFAIKKKKYAYFMISEDGGFKSVEGEPIVYKKGIAIARRDNCKAFRVAYEKILREILKKKPFEELLSILIDELRLLLEYKLPVEDLVIIRTLGASYKSDSYFMKIFSDELRRVGKEVNPGDRLEYVVVMGKDKLGYKMRLIEMYDETEEIDVMFYLNSLYANSIDQLFSICYQGDERLKSIGYKPRNSRKRGESIITPVNMISKMIDDLTDGSKEKIIEFSQTVLPNLLNFLKNTNEQHN